MFNRAQSAAFFCAALSAVSLLAAGCSSEKKESASAAKLVIHEWPGIEMPKAHAKFTEKHPNQEPEFVSISSDEDTYSKLKSGVEFDLAHICTQVFGAYAKSSLIQPIDTARIQEWKNLIPSFADLGKIDGVQYIMPYDWGYESILVRTDKVQKIPESWADLWDPQYAGHLALYDAADANHIATSLALGLDPWKNTPEQNEQIFQKMTALKPNVLTYWSDFPEVKKLVASGDVWVASNVWNDGYSALQAEGFSVKYVTPKEGRIGWLCGYAISSKTKNLNLAYEYLNALLDPQSQAALGDGLAYGVSSNAALALMDQRMVKRMQLNDPDVQGRTVFYKEWTEEQRKSNLERWNKAKAAAP